jgi:60S ribosome subunit biogenesis protein NIP7
MQMAANLTHKSARNIGVVVYSMADIPLGAICMSGSGRVRSCFVAFAGFGTTARATGECRKLEPSAIVVFHQADVGEYLREEQTLL